MTNWPLAAILAALACWLGVLGMRIPKRRWPRFMEQHRSFWQSSRRIQP